jgi:hypothetical protein
MHVLTNKKRIHSKEFVLSEMKLRGLVPIHVSVSDLYILAILLLFCCRN